MFTQTSCLHLIHIHFDLRISDFLQKVVICAMKFIETSPTAFLGGPTPKSAVNKRGCIWVLCRGILGILSMVGDASLNFRAS